MENWQELVLFPYHVDPAWWQVLLPTECSALLHDQFYSVLGTELRTLCVLESFPH